MTLQSLQINGSEKTQVSVFIVKKIIISPLKKEVAIANFMEHTGFKDRVKRDIYEGNTLKHMLTGELLTAEWYQKSGQWIARKDSRNWYALFTVALNSIVLKTNN